MGDQYFQSGREPRRFQGPVGEKRRRRDQEAWRRFRCAFGPLTEHQKQSQDLNGLAEPHVVREARAEIELGQEIKPTHARLLIGPKRSL